MPETLCGGGRRIVHDGKSSQDGSSGSGVVELRVESRDGPGIELRVESREEEILRELGIVHLGNKVTRPRYNDYETDAAILKEAGVSYINTAESEYDEGESKENKKREMNDKMTIKPLTRIEAEILRTAGVTWLDNMAVIYDDDTYYHKLNCATSATVAGTVGTNNTYAERELTRRLKHGWSSTGEDCEECGMPIICKSKGGLLECVICGVFDTDGGEDNYNPELLDEDEDEDNNYNCNNPDLLEDDDVAVPVVAVDGIENNHHGVLNVGTNMSTITESLAPRERAFGSFCQECQAELEEEDAVMGEDQCVQCRASECTEEGEHNREEEDPDAVYNEALGRRLFDGWELSKHNCENCNLPLISEFEGAPRICLRCG